MQMLLLDAAGMKTAGFNASRLEAVEYTAQELLACRFSVQELANMTRTSDCRGNSTMQPQPGVFTAQELQEANIAAAEMKAAGFTFQQLKGCRLRQSGAHRCRRQRRAIEGLWILCR